MMRVLIVEPAGNLWGSERALLDVLAGRPQAAFAVCCPPATPIVAELNKLSIPLLPFFVAGLHLKSRWARLRAALGVLRACLRFRPDVIHLNQAGCYRVAMLAAMLLRLPIVAHVRLFEDAGYLARCAARRGRLRAIIAVSNSIAREIATFEQLNWIIRHRTSST